LKYDFLTERRVPDNRTMNRIAAGGKKVSVWEKNGGKVQVGNGEI